MVDGWKGIRLGLAAITALTRKSCQQDRDEPVEQRAGLWGGEDECFQSFDKTGETCGCVQFSSFLSSPICHAFNRPPSTLTFTMPSGRERLLKVLTSYQMVLLTTGTFALMANDARRIGSWRVVFVPWYIADAAWLVALLLWAMDGARHGQQRAGRAVLYFIALAGKIAFDVLLPLRLDGVAPDVTFTTACSPLIAAMILLAGIVIVETRRSVARLR